MWKQEPLWVKRNENGVIVGISNQPPKTEDFVPSMPHPSEYPRKTKKAAGQGDNS